MVGSGGVCGPEWSGGVGSEEEGGRGERQMMYAY